MADQWQATKASADKFGLQVTGVELRDYPYDYEKALAQAPPSTERFLMMHDLAVLAATASGWRNLRLQQRIGSMSVFREYAAHGGLMTYGPNRNHAVRRSADYVHGSRAAPSRRSADRAAVHVRAVINLKTAKLLGLEFSQATLLRPTK